MASGVLGAFCRGEHLLDHKVPELGLFLQQTRKLIALERTSLTGT
jgi:hypothetical protein